MASAHRLTAGLRRGHVWRALGMLASAAMGLTASACGDRSASVQDTSPVPSASAPDPNVKDPLRPVLSIVDTLAQCDIDHRGLLLDMGSDVLRGRFGRQLAMPKSIVSSTHDGATWARIYNRKVKLRFVLPRPTKIFAEMRAIGRDSRRATIIVDNFVMSHLSLKKNQPHNYRTRITGLPLDAGEHTVELRFRGYKRTDAEPFAEVDWVRIGTPDNIERTYSPPTMADLVAPKAQLAGVPHRALALRGPSTVRCSVQIPPFARLRTHVGFAGTGSGLAELVVRGRDGDVSVIERVEVKGGETAEWTDVETSLHQHAGKVVSLELRVPRSSGSGRLLIGDPRIMVPDRPKPPLQVAQRAIVVVLNGVERSDLPPWSDEPVPHLPTLSRLSKTLTIFDNHRASSSLVPASSASLLTGLPVWQHNLPDGGARLPAGVTNIGQRAGEASVRAAMFSGVPLTFDAFGFGVGWDKFVVFPPNGGRLADAPLVDADAWLQQVDPKSTRKMLAFIHARGGHPPWEVTPKKARDLPPDKYTGNLQPRRSAQQIRDLKGRYSLLSEADIERMRAYFQVSLGKQDRALGNLIGALEEADMWDDTLLIVTGDVASARQQLFRDGGPLDESVLTLPLYVHFPKGKRAQQRVSRPTEQMDVAYTALAALGVQPPTESPGRHLELLAATPADAAQHMRLALSDEDYSLRWGEFVLRGTLKKRPKLCAIVADRACFYDRTYRHPLIADRMFRQLAELRHASKDAPPREPLSLDTDTAGMLAVWGAN